MTIEEKATAYDEAIKKLHEIITMDNKPVTPKEIGAHLFPELIESEDEKIRRWLIELVEEIRKANPTNADHNGDCSEAIAWLEKQGEKDEITFNDAHIIDSALNDYCCKQYSTLHKENGGVLSFARLQHLAMDIYGWCKKQGEQKPAWSEEDEKMYTASVFALAGFMGNEDKIDWLKSIKGRITWMPSDEQMEALQYVYRNINPPLSDKLGWNSLKTLELMFEQLKKLREE